MSRKVGIVELAAHNEVVWAYAKTLLHLTDEITIYTNEFTRKLLYDLQDTPQVSWVTQQGESNQSFIANNTSLLNRQDVLIFSTILPPDFTFFSTLSLKAKTYYVIHDANFFFWPKDHFFLRDGLLNATKDYVKQIRYNLKNEGDRNEDFLRSFDGLLVPAQSVYDYLNDKGITSKYNIAGVMNFAVNDSIPSVNPASEIQIVIPGSVSDKSRDFTPVITALALLKEKLQQKITITILGRAMDHRGQRIIMKLDKLNSSLLVVKTYEEFIPQQEFDAVMQAAHFLILPVNKMMKISTIKELNGYTCVSGNINDMIKSARPALVPDYYPVEDSMMNMVVRYNSPSDLADKILDMIEKYKNMDVSQTIKPHTSYELAQKIEEIIF